MTKTRRHHASRAGSTRPPSTARDIVRGREKPYRAEKTQILAKKRRDDTNTAVAKPPQGYTFVAFGSGSLIDRCKELSKERHENVFIVNAKPLTKKARDPDKVSFHVHRIGYHFKAEVVEDACAELHYTFQKGKFIHWTELKKQNDEKRAAEFLASRGMKLPDHELNRETEAQVRAAMKEHFPKMPQHDMDEVFKHAWADGSLRVGTNQDMDLSRRVQLAVLARIRHTYTDYDSLLKAFGDWEATRAEVEPLCLAKLMEWRGENRQDQAEERQWVKHDLIVIDDDEEEDKHRHKQAHAVDVGSDPDTDYSSDTSLEITHVQARPDDLGAESANEASQRYADRFQRRYRWPQREIQLGEYPHEHPAPHPLLIAYDAPPPLQVGRYPEYRNDPNSNPRTPTHHAPPAYNGYHYDHYAAQLPPVQPTLPQQQRAAPPPVYQMPYNSRPPYDVHLQAQQSQYQPQHYPDMVQAPIPAASTYEPPAEIIGPNGERFIRVARSIEDDRGIPAAAPQPPFGDTHPRSHLPADYRLGEERRFQAPLAVHGAPAPVQQMPRDQYLR